MHRFAFFFALGLTSAASALPTQISGKIVYQKGVLDILGREFAPSTCTVSVFQKNDALTFDVAFTDGDARGEYSFMVPAAQTGNFPDSTPPGPLTVKTNDDITTLKYEEDGTILLTTHKPAKHISLDFRGIDAGQYTVPTAWDVAKVIIVGNQLRFSLHQIPFYQLLTEGTLLSRARCTLDKPLLQNLPETQTPKSDRLLK